VIILKYISDCTAVNNKERTKKQQFKGITAILLLKPHKDHGKYLNA
jgi:hypothetical protein